MSSEKSSVPDIQVSLHLTTTEAQGLAYLCHVMEWNYLAEHCETPAYVIEARYALAKLRFALVDAGFAAMPNK